MRTVATCDGLTWSYNYCNHYNYSHYHVAVLTTALFLCRHSGIDIRLGLGMGTFIPFTLLNSFSFLACVIESFYTF